MTPLPASHLAIAGNLRDAQAQARTVHSPATLREFAKDFKEIEEFRAAAARGLAAQQAEKREHATFVRCRAAMLKVGRALFRMESTQSWTSNYPNWAALCRALQINRQHSYDLINYAVQVDKLDPTLLSLAFPAGPSFRESQAIAKLEPEQQKQVLNEGAATGDGADALARLTESLKGRAAPVHNEGIAPKQQKPEADISWAKRMTTTFSRWFEARGLGDKARPHLDALLALAEAHYAQKA